VTAGLIALGAALAVALAAGFAWKQRNGRMRSPAVRATATGLPMTGAELGEPLGQRATLVQFSTAFCAPCRATRRILAEVAGMTEGVAHVEIDAESHLDLVRRLDIRRTPTVLVLGPDGQIAKRATGQPRKADVIAALGDVAGLTY
jgi:thiol-disulfide isomerase/thioredoxin